MDRVIIIGAGGHCRAILSILRDTGLMESEGIYDIGTPRHNEKIMGVPVMGNILSFEKCLDIQNKSVILAIGDNKQRRYWFDKLNNLGCHFPNLIAKSAYVDPSSKLGVGNVICPLSFIGPESELENNIIVNTSAIVEHEVSVRSHSHLAPGSIVSGRSKIGLQVFVGANATIIKKAQVADESTIGAGAVVTKDITKKSQVWIGVPVKEIT